MKTILNFVFILALHFVALSGATPSFAASSNSCENLFAAGTTSVSPTGTVTVEVKPGEMVWDHYTCKACNSVASLRPAKHGEQGCRNCGSAYSGEPAEHPESFNDEQGRLYTIEPSALIKEGDPSAVYAKSGQAWKCGFCQGMNFQFMLHCDSCGGAKTGTAVPENEPTFQRPTYENESAAGTRFTSTPRTDTPTQTLDVHRKNGPSAFLKTRKGAVVMMATAVGAVGFIWWGTETYTLPGEVTRVEDRTAYITYTDKSGKPTTIDVTPPNKSKSVKTWRRGDQVTLYFRNLGGAKGAEGFDGTVLVPQKKK